MIRASPWIESPPDTSRRYLVLATWNYVAVLAGAASLAGVAGRIVEWRGVVAQVLQSYHALVHPVVEGLLSLFAVSIPAVAVDSLIVLGLAILRPLHSEGSGGTAPFWSWCGAVAYVCALFLVVNTIGL